jgi:glutamate dehydrogenase (NADP+)
MTDVPAGDIGTGARELGYIYGKLKELRNRNEMGMISGKPVSMGGSLARKEATGYGAVHFLVNMLEGYDLLGAKHFPERDKDYLINLVKNQPLLNRKVCVSGSGNVSIYASEKIIQLGGIVIAMSDSSGTLISKTGICLDTIKEIKEVKKGRLSDYTSDREFEHIPKENYIAGQHAIWNIEGTDIAMPCATQNELTLNDARNLIKHGCIAVVEGANMPSTKAAVELFLENKDNILFAPGKASNSGGVATSYLEMAQNAARAKWSFEKVEFKISEIMYGVFKNSFDTAKKYNDERNIVMGANIYSFERLVEEMGNQGIIS